MKEYIKKFESLNAADDHVIDNPFISYIVGQGNLVCGEPNKKLKLEGGLIVIANAVTLISFTIDNEMYQAEEGMTWEEWLESDYNPNSSWHAHGYGGPDYVCNGNDMILYSDDSDVPVWVTDTITAANYFFSSNIPDNVV